MLTDATDNDSGAITPLILASTRPGVQRLAQPTQCRLCTAAGSAFVNTSATLSSVCTLRTFISPCAKYSRTLRSRRST
eukprot:1541094-Pleurochrysis_carterae.AAC.1